MTTATVCQHHTQIEPPNGPFVRAVCSKCGRVQMLPSAFPEESQTGFSKRKGGPAIALMPKRTPTDRVYAPQNVRRDR